jgi:hypothetical protein
METQTTLMLSVRRTTRTKEPMPSKQFTQQVYVRIRGRQMAFKVSSDELGVQWQLGVPRIDIRPDGRR